jgi:lipoprotein NlpI
LTGELLANLGSLWLFRAVAAQWSRSIHADALKRHFAKPSPNQGLGSDRYYVLGRLVMGLENEEVGTSLRGTTPSTMCEAAFYLGARAQGLGKLDEAHDWYRVAVETSLPGENEYRFALSQLTLWSREGKSLARIAKETTAG